MPVSQLFIPNVFSVLVENLSRTLFHCLHEHIVILGNFDLCQWTFFLLKSIEKRNRLTKMKSHRLVSLIYNVGKVWPNCVTFEQNNVGVEFALAANSYLFTPAGLVRLSLYSWFLLRVFFSLDFYKH